MHHVITVQLGSSAVLRHLTPSFPSPKKENPLTQGREGCSRGSTHFRQPMTVILTAADNGYLRDSILCSL